MKKFHKNVVVIVLFYQRYQKFTFNLFKWW